MIDDCRVAVSNLPVNFLQLMIEAELPREILPQEPVDITQKSIPPGVKVDLDEEFVEELTDAIENSPTELIVDLGEEEVEEVPKEEDGDEDGDEDEDDKEGEDGDKKSRRRLQRATAAAFSGVVGYRPPLVTTVGGCAATRFGCCGYATRVGVVNVNLARINRFGSNCPGRRAAFLDVCRRSTFGCCSRPTGFNIPCRNRLCTNDILYAPRPRAVAVAAAAAGGRGGVAAAAAVAIAPRRVVTPRFVSTPYAVGFGGGGFGRPAIAAASATAVAGGVGRPLIGTRRFGIGGFGVGGLGYGGVGGLGYGGGVGGLGIY